MKNKSIIVGSSLIFISTGGAYIYKVIKDKNNSCKLYNLEVIKANSIKFKKDNKEGSIFICKDEKSSPILLFTSNGKFSIIPLRKVKTIINSDLSLTIIYKKHNLNKKIEFSLEKTDSGKAFEKELESFIKGELK